MKFLLAAALAGTAAVPTPATMTPVTVNGVRLEYAVSGKGDAVLLSLALLEPPLLAAVPSGPAFMEGIGPVVQMYRDGNKAGAIDAFMTPVVGPGYAAAIGRAVGPAAFDLAVTDAPTLFEIEFPALQGWTFTRGMTVRIPQPVLTVVGAESAPVFKESNLVLKEWFPRADEVVVPNATHGLQMMNPSAVGQGLARFYAGQRGKK